MELSGDTPVTLIIKAPNQRMADHTVDCMLGWTIQKLKQHLEAVYPSKPKQNDQKLIYSGRLLQDHLTLKEILRQYDSTFSSEHTLHLVCSSAMDSSPSPMSSSSQNTTASSSNGNSPCLSDYINSNSINAYTTEGARYRGHDQASKQASTSVQSDNSVHQASNTEGGITASYPAYQYTAEQYAWMVQQQQMYSQYMMQYMQYYQSIFNPGQSFSPLAASLMQQSAATNTVPQQQPHVNEAAAAANNGAPGGGRQNVRMNAQGGVEEDDEEGEPRDWLHHAYFFMRFLTFMAILFFYSSLSRFFVVFCGFFTIYILQRFRNYLQRVYHEQEQQRQQQQNNQQQEEPERAGVTQEEGQEGTPPAESSTQVDQQQPHTTEENGSQTRVFVFICNTVQAFFTSLIPTPPELLQQN